MIIIYILGGILLAPVIFRLLLLSLIIFPLWLLSFLANESVTQDSSK